MLWKRLKQQQKKCVCVEQVRYNWSNGPEDYTIGADGEWELIYKSIQMCVSADSLVISIFCCWFFTKRCAHERARTQISV